jgi:hypothetical protein
VIASLRAWLNLLENARRERVRVEAREEVEVGEEVIK